METEQTLVLIKPDGVQRGLIGEVIARYEHKGLKIVGMKLLQLPRDTAEKLYVVHQGKAFYEVLIEFMTSAPIVALAIEGRDAIELVRILNGEPTRRSRNPEVSEAIFQSISRITSCTHRTLHRVPSVNWRLCSHLKNATNITE